MNFSFYILFASTVFVFIQHVVLLLWRWQLQFDICLLLKSMMMMMMMWILVVMGNHQNMMLLFLLGDRWQSSAAVDEWHDDEVYGFEARPSTKNLQRRWEAQVTEI